MMNCYFAHSVKTHKSGPRDITTGPILLCSACTDSGPRHCHANNPQYRPQIFSTPVTGITQFMVWFDNIWEYYEI